MRYICAVLLLLAVVWYYVQPRVRAWQIRRTDERIHKRMREFIRRNIP